LRKIVSLYQSLLSTVANHDPCQLLNVFHRSCVGLIATAEQAAFFHVWTKLGSCSYV
jgi:hypothetical protein